MGIFTVLRAVPWTALLANGPTLVRAAENVLSRSRAQQTEAVALEIRALADRLHAAEERQIEISALLRQLADQTEQLTKAVDLLAARVRWLTITAIAAAALAVVSLVLAIALQ